MGRQREEYYQRPNSIWYVRWHEDGKVYRLSTGTKDKLEAHRRGPSVMSIKMSWDTYQRSISQFKSQPNHSLAGVGPYSISPPINFKGTSDGIKELLETAIKNGWAEHQKERGEWVIKIPENSENLISFEHGIGNIKTILQGSDDLKEIKKFYSESVLQLYKDKKTASRFGRIWITFLLENQIKSWSQINEPLLIKFKEWRKTTPIANNNQRNPSPPGTRVINRHIKYLSKGFKLAVNRGFLHHNPIEFWIPDSHNPAVVDSLKPEELLIIFNDELWQKDYLFNGKRKISLGYKLLDILILLFVSCKRRKEVLHLKIIDVELEESLVTYIETKNSSKGTSYNIQKAFYVHEKVKTLLRRVIGKRTNGMLFPVDERFSKTKKPSEIGYFNMDTFSEYFKECAKKHFPNRQITIKSLRQTSTDIMEKAKVSDNEIDAALGHHHIKTALPFYQDRSHMAQARRLAGRTKIGIDVLCDFAQDYL